VRPERSTIYFAVGLLAGSAVLSLGLGSLLHTFLHISPRDLRAMVRSLGLLGGPFITLLIAVIIVFIPVPTIPVELVAGVVFGIAMGTLLVFVGHLLGALIAFLLAKRFGRPLLRRWLGTTAMAKLDPLAEQSGFWFIFFMRLLPLFDFKLVSYAAGLSAMRVRRYMLATGTGIFVPILILDTIGATAAARPRDAAIIAAAYSLAVGGTIAYFLVPRRKRVVHVHHAGAASAADATGRPLHATGEPASVPEGHRGV